MKRSTKKSKEGVTTRLDDFIITDKKEESQYEAEEQLREQREEEE